MTDRELLELAARAAGYDFRWGGIDRLGDDVVDCSDLAYIVNGASLVYWDPLNDDGDALRLAVKLHIDFKAFETSVRTWVGDPVAQRVIASIEELCETDPYAATRRAIVRAAAEIGKAML